MPAYHSELNDLTIFKQYPCISGIYLLPFKTKVKGPSPPFSALEHLQINNKDPSSTTVSTHDPVLIHTAHILSSNDDAIDEALYLYRANCLFKNFEFKSLNDKLLVYCTLFISELLSKVKMTMTNTEVSKLWNQLAMASFSLPGEPGFTLNALYSAPESKNDTDQLRQYLLQLRQEIAIRLHERVFTNTSDRPSKWWVSFQKRKFMNKTLSSS